MPIEPTRCLLSVAASLSMTALSCVAGLAAVPGANDGSTPILGSVGSQNQRLAQKLDEVMRKLEGYQNEKVQGKRPSNFEAPTPQDQTNRSKTKAIERLDKQLDRDAVQGLKLREQ
jgi:hypothetical protein